VSKPRVTRTSPAVLHVRGALAPFRRWARA
jgi:hypothetical protein